MLFYIIFVCVCNALKHNWEFDAITKSHFMIQRFGFHLGGKATLKLNAVGKLTKASPLMIGIAAESSMLQVLKVMRDLMDEEICEQSIPNVAQIDFFNRTTWEVSRVIGRQGEQPGYYYIYFLQCYEGARTPLTFELHADLVNPNDNFLSAGKTYLPDIYLIACIGFILMSIVWVRFLKRHPSTVMGIHRMMAVLVILKAFYLFSQSMRYRYMKRLGDDSLTSWTAVYYVFGFLKGMMLFVLLLLIASGWSFVKPHLNKLQKRIVLLVLILQIVNRIALIEAAEHERTPFDWRNWKNIADLFDIACCVFVFYLTVRSIQALQLSQQIDGKESINLQKLRQFRSFYFSVILYVYATRYIIQIVVDCLPYNYAWLQEFGIESAAAAFYLSTGYKFRPIPRNPYLPVQSSDIDPLDEFGLNSDDEKVLPRLSTSHNS